MSAYKATSWGRTRRPKQLSDDNIVPTFQGKTTGTNVVVSAVGNLDATLTSGTEGRNGYSTENQKFLHVLIKHNTSAQKSVNIYGYNYAFGEWSPLLLSLGNATNTAAVATTGASGEAQLYIFDVSGVDRVAFVQTPTDAPDRVRAAFTTF